jgi:hypothetical protein
LNAFLYQINAKIASKFGRSAAACNCHPPCQIISDDGGGQPLGGTHASSTPLRSRYSFSALLPSKHVHVTKGGTGVSYCAREPGTLSAPCPGRPIWMQFWQSSSPRRPPPRPRAPCPSESAAAMIAIHRICQSRCGDFACAAIGSNTARRTPRACTRPSS